MKHGVFLLSCSSICLPLSWLPDLIEDESLNRYNKLKCETPGLGVNPRVAFSIEKKLIFFLSLGCAFDSTCRHLFLLKWFCMKKLESISIPQGSLVWWHYIYSVYINKFRLFVNVRNRKDVVLKTSCAVVIR